MPSNISNLWEDKQGVTNALRGYVAPADTNANTIIAAQGSGYRIAVTKLIISMDAGTAAVGTITLKTGSTTIAVLNAATAGAAATNLYQIDFDKPIVCGDNEAFTATLSTTTNFAPKLLAVGFKCAA